MAGGGTLAAFASAGFAAIGKSGKKYLSLIAAGVAFYTMLSVFPALAALIAILSLIADPTVVVVQLEEMRELMPEDVYDILNAQIVGLVSTSSDTLGWTGVVSLMVALWSARAGVGSMIHGLNVVHDLQSRATLRHFLRAILLTIALVAVGLIALLAVVIAPVVLSFLALGSITSVIIDILRWSVAVVVILTGIGLLYRFGPNRQPRKTRMLTPGSIFAATSWAALSIAFSYYVSHFGNYNEVYGSIGAVIAMLVWLWISSMLVLLGAAFNAELAARMPQLVVDKDTNAVSTQEAAVVPAQEGAVAALD